MEKVLKLSREKKYPCLVCSYLFGRDRLMILAETESGRKYICQSEIWEDFGCGFIFPEEMKEEEIRRAAFERVNFLKTKISK